MVGISIDPPPFRLSAQLSACQKTTSDGRCSTCIVDINDVLAIIS